MDRYKKIFVYLICSLLFAANFSVAAAQVLDPKAAEEVTGGIKNTSDSAGYVTSGGTNQIGTIVALAIKAFLGLLGIIFVYLIVLAGYNWMTAAGDEQKVEKAKDEIKRAVIGLVIVVSAYAIAYFVLDAMKDVASPTGTMSTGG